MEAILGRLARYAMLKILYERAFPAWLETRNAKTVNCWNARASDCATKAVKSIDSNPDASSLEELGPVSLDPVDSADDRGLWEAMMATHHPLGWGRLPGGKILHLIRSKRSGVLSLAWAIWQFRERFELQWLPFGLIHHLTGRRPDQFATADIPILAAFRQLALAGNLWKGSFSIASRMVRPAWRDCAEDAGSSA